MVVDTGKREISLPRGLPGHFSAVQPLDRPVGVNDAPAASARRCRNCCAAPWMCMLSPRPGPHSIAGFSVASASVTSTENVMTYDSGSSRNTFFARSPSPLSNSKVTVVGVDVASIVAGDVERYSAVFSRALLACVGEAQRKGPGRRGRQTGRHHLDRRAGLVEVPRELPALHNRAAVAESRAHRARRRRRCRARRCRRLAAVSSPGPAHGDILNGLLGRRGGRRRGSREAGRLASLRQALVWGRRAAWAAARWPGTRRAPGTRGRRQSEHAFP